MITVQKNTQKYDLKMAITEYIRNVDCAILNTVFENTVRRVNKCLESGGGHFEHYFNFLYCNHQVNREFLITLYKETCCLITPDINEERTYFRTFMMKGLNLKILKR
jgi:hypothetical protein